MRKKFAIAAVILVIGVGIAGWYFRKPILGRYYVSRLATSSDEATLERVANLGEYSIPPLVELLKQDGPACRNAATAFQRVLDGWLPDDPRAAHAAKELADSAGQFSSAGKLASLDIADALLARGPGCKEPATALVRNALHDDQVSCQVRGIILALKPEFSLAIDLVPLLNDPKPEVRRSAMLGLGPLRDVVPDDDLLPHLHDSDAKVRMLCESALKSRGLREKDVMLARLITDPSPLKRLEVIRFLPSDSQLDPRAWLERLCQDPSPVVRASAARSALEPGLGVEVEMIHRIRQMAKADPNGTVRQIAEYLVRSRQGGSR